MTIPNTTQLPNPYFWIKEKNNDSVIKYLEELTYRISDVYESLAQHINGDIRLDTGNVDELWTPTLQGSTSGTFTYDNQYGWIIRRGLMVELWFDIKWTAAGTAANNLYLELPYKVANANGKPFVGVVQPSGITVTGGTDIVINAIPNTYRGEFWNTGSAFTTANQSVVASGQLIGFLRYIGQRDEAG